MPERCRPLDTVLEQFKTSSYPYSVLAQDKLPEGVDRTRLEEYLSDDEFTRVFSMSRAEFQKLPAWKQSNLKKAAKLF